MSEPSEPKRRKAIALRYNAEEDTAPRVIAKGAGIIAEKILALAQEHHIHVHQDPGLAGLLAKLEINVPIPEELYRAVAEILAFVYRLNERMGRASKHGPLARP